MTGERLCSEIVNDITIEHLHRYSFSKKFINGKIVLDVACGEGYGAYHIADQAKFTFGIDIDSETIELAQKKYSRNNLKYYCCSVEKLPLDDESIDVILSFETIEHVSNINKMIDEFKRVLKPSGLLILSTPDKKHYSDERNYKNPYHLKEFYLKEFQKFMCAHFTYNCFCVQKVINHTSLITSIKRFGQVDFFDGTIIDFKEVKLNHKILISISSNSLLNRVNDSIFTGEKITQFLKRQNCKEVEGKIKNTITFKIGRMFMIPVILLRRLMNNRK